MKRSGPLKRKTALKAKVPMKRASKPKMTPIRKSAKGEPCTVRVPGVCNGNPETVVLAHLNGAGVGLKADDHKAAYCCSACHEWLDGGYAREGHFRDFRDLLHMEGVLRTQDRLIEKGLMQIQGAA